jgi:hypothetical protein
MIIERKKNELVIRLPNDMDTKDIQDLLNYLEYKEATSKSKAKQEDIDKIAKEAKKGIWTQNRDKYIK